MNEIQELISQYMKDNKYISCLEEIYVLFEKNHISFNDRKSIMIQIYKYNQKMYALEQKKSENLDKIENHKNVVVECKEETVVISPKIKKSIEPLHCDVSVYIEKIKNFSDISELDAILPQRGSEQFDNIIDMLLTILYQEKVEMINLIHEQQQFEPDIYQFFDNELEDIDFRIEALLDYKNACLKVEEIDFEANTNKIIFLKNSMGEPIIFSNLKGYEDYYDSFLELINSIINGNFKNSRVFSNNDKIVDMMEVKGFKTRILLSRLKDNIFVVMSAFVKKCDTDLRHRNLLHNVSYIYQNQKEILLNLINSEQFMEQEEDYLNDLVEKLKEKRKGNVK